MEQSKKDKLTDAGFQIGTAEEFLNLSDDEIRTIEDKIREYKPKTKLGKKLIDTKYSGILLDADSLLNEPERATIDRNEHFGRPRRVVVNCLRYQFFASTALACNQHRRITI